MVKSLICCLFMLRKFSTQSGLTDLQHASLEDKVWFDCREFTWHRLRFYILASLCLFRIFDCLSSYLSRRRTSTPFHVLPTGETFLVLKRWSKNVFGNHQFFFNEPLLKNNRQFFYGLEISLFLNFPTKLSTPGKDQSTTFATSTLPTVLCFRSSNGSKFLIIHPLQFNFFLPPKAWSFW